MTVLESRVLRRSLVVVLQEAGATEASCNAVMMRILDAARSFEADLELRDAPGRKARLSVREAPEPTHATVRIELPEGVSAERVQAALEGGSSAAVDGSQRAATEAVRAYHRALEQAGTPDGGPLTAASLELVMRAFRAPGVMGREAVLAPVYGKGTPEPVRARLERWLLEQFRDDANDACRWRIADCLRVHASSSSTPMLLELLRDRRYGDGRQPLVEALTHLAPAGLAAELAALADDPSLSLVIATALGALKSREHEEVLRRLSRHSSSAVRRAAEKALRGMGAEAPSAPAPNHRVRGRTTRPKGLEEWSTNLDIEDLQPSLEALRGIVGNELDVNEITGVVGELDVDQAATFRYALDGAGELWVTVLMSDVDSPDLQIWAPPALASRAARLLEALLD